MAKNIIPQNNSNPQLNQSNKIINNVVLFTTRFFGFVVGAVTAAAINVVILAAIAPFNPVLALLANLFVGVPLSYLSVAKIDEFAVKNVNPLVANAINTLTRNKSKDLSKDPTVPLEKSHTALVKIEEQVPMLVQNKSIDAKAKTEKVETEVAKSVKKATTKVKPKATIKKSATKNKTIRKKALKKTSIPNKSTSKVESNAASKRTSKKPVVSAKTKSLKREPITKGNRGSGSTSLGA